MGKTRGHEKRRVVVLAVLGVFSLSSLYEPEREECV
jgi:hypothetical protein